MKIKANLIEFDKINKNIRVYSKNCIEKYIKESEEQVSNNGVPVVIREYDEFGFVKLPLDKHCKIVGAGTVNIDGEVLKFSGNIADNVDITDKYCVPCCLGDTVDNNGTILVNNIQSFSLTVDICDNSAYFDKPNIKILD